MGAGWQRCATPLLVPGRLCSCAAARSVLLLKPVAGAIAVIVIQTADVWPFTMRAKAGESINDATGYRQRIRLMVRQEHGARLLRLLAPAARPGDDVKVVALVVVVAMSAAASVMRPVVMRASCRGFAAVSAHGLPVSNAQYASAASKMA